MKNEKKNNAVFCCKNFNILFFLLFSIVWEFLLREEKKFLAPFQQL